MTSCVLLCATDAGGVANLAPLVRVLDEVFVMTTERYAARFDVPEPRLILGGDPDQTIDRVAPAAIIAGTTRYDSPERRLLSIAAERGIRSIAVLDERYLYRARFGETLPDLITLIDDDSVAEAIAEGLPAERLRVTGSPAIADLVARLHGNPPPRPNFLPSGRPVVTFLSETLAADYGTSPENPGPMGAFVGYTEETVLAELMAMDLDVTLIDKQHPSDEDSARRSRAVRHDRVVPNPRPRVITIRDTPLWALLWHSDAVVGMRSMALLEAALMGVPALSFQPGLIGDERCTAVRLGLIPQTTRADEAKRWLAGVLQNPAPRTPAPYAYPDAAERIVKLALS